MGTKTLELIFAWVFFPKSGKQDCSESPCPSVLAWLAGARFRVGAECGVAGRVPVVCLQPPGMGEDVRIGCVWVYGIISFKDFHDPVVQ